MLLQTSSRCSKPCRSSLITLSRKVTCKSYRTHAGAFYMEHDCCEEGSCKFVVSSKPSAIAGIHK